MPELWTAVALFIAVAAVFFILWRIAALHAATKELPTGIESALAEKHRAMLSDLHAGLNSQATDSSRKAPNPANVCRRRWRN